jgi:L-threonylcarbamoyladenylate synthase
MGFLSERKSTIVKADRAALLNASRIVHEGGLVAFPTETVYGLGADATNGLAVARIFEVKGRPRFNPLIVHVATAEDAREIASFNETAEMLAARFWPGPLTLVLPLLAGGRHRIHPLATAGLDTVAIRFPSHPIARQLLETAGLPLAAPSANLSGHVSPTEARHVCDDLGDRIEMILDGGPSSAGIESTILALTPSPTLLRPGAVPREAIEDALEAPLGNHPSDEIRAPGQLASHYAPQAALRLNALKAAPGEILLGFGPDAPESSPNLSPAGDLREAAANLFSCLRTLDAQGAERVAVMPIPEKGLGEAINDRLRRAAAPKEQKP